MSSIFDCGDEERDEFLAASDDFGESFPRDAIAGAAELSEDFFGGHRCRK